MGAFGFGFTVYTYFPLTFESLVATAIFFTLRSRCAYLYPPFLCLLFFFYLDWCTRALDAATHFLEAWILCLRHPPILLPAGFSTNCILLWWSWSLEIPPCFSCFFVSSLPLPFSLIPVWYVRKLLLCGARKEDNSYIRKDDCGSWGTCYQRIARNMWKNTFLLVSFQPFFPAIVPVTLSWFRIRQCCQIVLSLVLAAMLKGCNYYSSMRNKSTSQ